MFRYSTTYINILSFAISIIIFFTTNIFFSNYNIFKSKSFLEANVQVESSNIQVNPDEDEKKDTIEDAKIEINEYPGNMTECPYDEFTDAVTIDSFDGSKALCTADFWFDGEESDLSMECIAEFYGRELKRISINQIHVF